MSERIMRAGIMREKNWLYYLDSNLNVCRAKMVHGRRKEPASRPELILRTELKRDPKYLYYVDKTGDISRVLACRGGSIRKGKKSRKTTLAEKRRLVLKKKATRKAVPRKNSDKKLKKPAKKAA